MMFVFIAHHQLLCPRAKAFRNLILLPLVWQPWASMMVERVEWEVVALVGEQLAVVKKDRAMWVAVVKVGEAQAVAVTEEGM